jgi:hypothetical protein
MKAFSKHFPPYNTFWFELKEELKITWNLLNPIHAKFTLPFSSAGYVGW